MIREFAEAGPQHGYQCRWMTAVEVRALSPGVRAEGLLGGLWSETEMVVDPRKVARELPAALADTATESAFATASRSVRSSRRSCVPHGKPGKWSEW